MFREEDHKDLGVILGPPFVNIVTYSRLFNFSETQFPHLLNGMINLSLRDLM
jgi:hypothetical protein